MKHVFYGLTQEAYIASNVFEIKEIEFDLRYPTEFRLNYFNYSKSKLETYIKELSEECSLHYPLLYKSYVTRDKKTYIYETNDSHTLEVGDKVELYNKIGRIEDRECDAVNDVMYYYTNIVQRTKESDSLDQQMEIERLSLLERCKGIYSEHFGNMYDDEYEVDEPNERKGFWAWLLGS